MAIGISIALAGTAGPAPAAHFERFDCAGLRAVAANVVAECLPLAPRLLAALWPVDAVTTTDRLIDVPRFYGDVDFIGVGVTALGGYFQLGNNPLDTQNALLRCFCVQRVADEGERTRSGQGPPTTSKRRLP